MKPRKKWEPKYNFGGNPADLYWPGELGVRYPGRVPKSKKRKKK